MRFAKVCVLAAGVLAALPPALFASDCRQVSRIAPDTAGGALTTQAARVCGVQVLATAANARCDVFASPDGTSAHAQRRYLAEPGAATSGDSDAVAFFGQGAMAETGLGADVVNGQCFVFWDSSP